VFCADGPRMMCLGVRRELAARSLEKNAEKTSGFSVSVFCRLYMYLVFRLVSYYTALEFSGVCPQPQRLIPSRAPLFPQNYIRNYSRI
jgi:hypothetical protein